MDKHGALSIHEWCGFCHISYTSRSTIACVQNNKMPYALPHYITITERVENGVLHTLCAIFPEREIWAVIYVIGARPLCDNNDTSQHLPHSRVLPLAIQIIPSQDAVRCQQNRSNRFDPHIDHPSYYDFDHKHKCINLLNKSVQIHCLVYAQIKQ